MSVNTKMRTLLLSVVLPACSQQATPPAPAVSAEPPASVTTTTSSSAMAAQGPSTPLEVPMVALKGGLFKTGFATITPDKTFVDTEKWATVPPFQIEVTEVTVEAYRRCVNAGVCQPPSGKLLGGDPDGVARPDMEDRRLGTPCNFDLPAHDQYPVNCLNWHQAEIYCRWVGKHLPSEEVWEFAARGRERRDFPWGPGVPGTPYGGGDQFELRDRVRGNCEFYERTCPVKSAPSGATPQGVFDLAGNVSEWTTSEYCDKSIGGCTPVKRMVRGGFGIDSGGAVYQGTFRFARLATSGSGLIGFRCVKLAPADGGAP